MEEMNNEINVVESEQPETINESNSKKHVGIIIGGTILAIGAIGLITKKFGAKIKKKHEAKRVKQLEKKGWTVIPPMDDDIGPMPNKSND